MKIYEAVFDENAMEGVYALSVVENPAMEDMFIALSDEQKQNKIELATIDEDKRLLLGAALIPEKEIYRNIDGHEFFIKFSSETIEKLAHAFSKNQNNNNSSLEHEIALNGMSVVENWIVQDTEKDKSSNFGKSYPVGTWVTMMKVDNDDVWQKVKNGEIKGFSIDALLGLTEVKFNKLNNSEMTRTDFIDALKEVLRFNKPEEVKEVVETPEQEIEVAAEEVAEEVTEQAPQFDLEAITEALKEELGQFRADVKKEIEDLKVEFSKEVESKDKEIEDLKVELSKEPEVEPIKAKPEAKKVEVKFNTPQTTKSNAMKNIAEAMGW